MGACGACLVRRFGASVLRCFGVSALRRFGVSALRRFGASALRCFGASAFRRFGVSALRRFGASALRRFGASALRRFGASALRRKYRHHSPPPASHFRPPINRTAPTQKAPSPAARRMRGSVDRRIRRSPSRPAADAATSRARRRQRRSSVEAAGARHVHQPRDPLLGGGVRREQILQPTARQRIHDHHLRGGRMLLGCLKRNARRIAVDLVER
ncbi:Uncharacterised protein [Burkholderia pseudomallei]|nr:Uncharacterised protein [Burkholderia pseudomallei]